MATATSKNVPVETSVAVAPYRHIPAIAGVQGIGADQRVLMDIGVECGGCGACPVEIAAYTDIAAASGAGSVENGTVHYADIIAVSGDPLADITVMYHVDFVMKGGQVIKDPAHTDRNPVSRIQ